MRNAYGFPLCLPTLIIPEAQPQEKKLITLPGKAEPFRTVLRPSREWHGRNSYQGRPHIREQLIAAGPLNYSRAACRRSVRNAIGKI